MTTTIQEMQKYIKQLQESCETHCERIAELENDNQELANAIEATDHLNSERISELEEVKRLDAALDEIEVKSAGHDFAMNSRLAPKLVSINKIARKARETK
jgi:predicted nuclease with TOPRIM domain